MNNSEEDIKNKINLDNLFSKPENKAGTSDTPSQAESQDIPPVLKPESEPSLIKKQEDSVLKLKLSGAKLPEPEEKNIPIQDVKIQDVKLKVKPIKILSDTTDRKEGLPQIPKSNEQIRSSTNVTTGLGEKPCPLNFINTEREKTQEISANKISSPKPIIDLNEINIPTEESPVSQEEEKDNTHLNDFEIVSSSSAREKHISDTIKLRLKPKTSSSSAFSVLTSEEKTEEENRNNTPAKENISKESASTVSGVTGNTAKTPKNNIKYIYIAGALVIIIILLYFLISTITTLMTI